MTIRELTVLIDCERVFQDSFDDPLLAYELRVSVEYVTPAVLVAMYTNTIVRADYTKSIGHCKPAPAYYNAR